MKGWSPATCQKKFLGPLYGYIHALQNTPMLINKINCFCYEIMEAMKVSPRREFRQEEKVRNLMECDSRYSIMKTFNRKIFERFRNLEFLSYLAFFKTRNPNRFDLII
jgi:hypothetical protein